MLRGAGVQTLVDVRRYPGSRRNPQYNRPALEQALAAEGIAYRHAEALGGRLRNEPGEERFACLRVAAFRSYAARMGSTEWQEALASALAEPRLCFMCAETPWTKCHRRFIGELLTARGHEVLHLSPTGVEPHRPLDEAEARDGRLYLCGEVVA
ncbi:MAG TPA: DUF488 domain-containing protein [Gaiellaceae bacterium]|nr:DUF488 domain-containing protein [Gaiellaceae bacterium]